MLARCLLTTKPMLDRSKFGGLALSLALLGAHFGCQFELSGVEDDELSDFAKPNWEVAVISARYETDHKNKSVDMHLEFGPKHEESTIPEGMSMFLTIQEVDPIGFPKTYSFFSYSDHHNDSDSYLRFAFRNLKLPVSSVFNPEYNLYMTLVGRKDVDALNLGTYLLEVRGDENNGSARIVMAEPIELSPNHSIHSRHMPVANVVATNMAKTENTPVAMELLLQSNYQDLPFRFEVDTFVVDDEGELLIQKHEDEAQKDFIGFTNPLKVFSDKENAKALIIELKTGLPQIDTLNTGTLFVIPLDEDQNAREDILTFESIDEFIRSEHSF